jgi:hypothetical protein
MQQNVIVLGGGEFEAGTQVVGLKERVVVQDFFPAGTVGEQLQNIFHAQAITANAGTSAALAGFDRDAREKRAHAGNGADFSSAGNCGNGGVRRSWPTDYTEATGSREAERTDFLTTTERGSAEMATLASVARNAVRGD